MDANDKIVNSGPEPELKGAGGFKIMVAFNGIVQGWLTNSGQPEYWITVVDNEADGSLWYQVASSGSTYISTGSNNYLSYRTGQPSALGMKMRGWTYAAKWQLAGKNLKCLDNGQLVGMDGKSFYVNDQNVVDVKYVPI